MPGTNRPLRVLLIEDNPDHAQLIQRQLTLAADCRIESMCCGRLDDGLRALASSAYDAVLLDLRLPDSDAPDTVHRTASAAPTVPIVVLTSSGDVEMGVRAVQDGAEDYLVKTQMAPETLLRSLRYAIERKRIREEVERYAIELERSNRELDQFARIVSHDLKSPLAVLQMDLSMVASRIPTQDPEVQRFLDSATEQAQNMSDLIDGILQFARVQKGESALEEVDLEATLTRVLDALRAEIDGAAATVTHDLLPGIRGHDTQLGQLLQNLIANAIKYRGPAPVCIHVSAELLDREWVFSVADNGQGVPEDARVRIFEMFQRAHGDEISGTGIGLATCKRIVELHGGRIWVDANESGGSTFYFTLPLAGAAPRAPARSAGR